MTSPKSITSNNAAKKWILFGIPVVFILASPLHFLFDWTGRSPVIGIFTPVNESVWEHFKLTFWPLLSWWIVGYFLLRKNNKISARKWFVSCAISIFICNLFILSFFYISTGAFGIESLALDILSLFLGLVIGQFLALHIYQHANPGKGTFFLSVLFLLVMAAIFILFTFAPPEFPLFLDSGTGTYGIT